MNNLTKLFVASLALAILGGLLFVLGLGSSMGPGGRSWLPANELLSFGKNSLILGGVLNLLCTVLGAVAITRGNAWNWWYPLNVLATIGALWWGWIALNL